MAFATAETCIEDYVINQKQCLFWGRSHLCSITYSGMPSMELALLLEVQQWQPPALHGSLVIKNICSDKSHLSTNQRLPTVPDFQQHSKILGNLLGKIFVLKIFLIQINFKVNSICLMATFRFSLGSCRKVPGLPPMQQPLATEVELTFSAHIKCQVTFHLCTESSYSQDAPRTIDYTWARLAMDIIIACFELILYFEQKHLNCKMLNL